jgi:hypothetical protein
MSDDTKEITGFIVAILGVAILPSYMTHSGTDWSWRRQIAGHHAAEFYIDENNYRQWRWIDCNPAPVSAPTDINTGKPINQKY